MGFILTNNDRDIDSQSNGSVGIAQLLRGQNEATLGLLILCVWRVPL